MHIARVGVATAVLGLLGCSSTTGASDPKCGEVRVAIEGGTHVPEGTAVTYAANPPSSGNHWPCWAKWGVASTVLPPERYVHNLEHGGVVLLYRCTAAACDDAKNALAAVAAAAPDAPTGGHRLVVNADATLPTAFAAVAWGWTYTSDTVDQANLLCFIQAHEGQGPEDVSGDPPATCPQ
jgi:hypothetical protein